MMKTCVASSVTTASVLLCAVAIDAAQPANAAIDPTSPLDDRCWDLQFVDDFDSLDLRSSENPTGLWKPAYLWGPDIVINKELQYYVDPEILGAEYSPFSIDDGVLSIEARRTPRELLERTNGQEYLSGVMTSKDAYSQKYGRFEAILKQPAGQGFWSAFWLLPDFEKWPEGIAILPELDVMEFLGHAPRTLHTTLHTNQNGPLESHQYDHYDLDDDLTKSFHRYSVVWTPSSVHWYLDREHIASHPTPKDFTRPKRFMLNLAVGGSWPGAPDKTTPLPARYQIDQVSAWQPSEDC